MQRMGEKQKTKYLVRCVVCPFESVSCKDYDRNQIAFLFWDKKQSVLLRLTHQHIRMLEVFFSCIRRRVRR